MSIIMIVEHDLKKLSKLAANELLDEIQEVIKAKGKVILGLPGGRSVSRIYDEISSSKEIEWEKVHIFLVDERAVPLDSIESNYKLIMDSFGMKLISNGLIPKSNIHPFNLDKKKLDFGASKYFDELTILGGNFDIVLLSSGEDGHVAALYPNKKLEEKNDCYFGLNDSPKPPPNRITASYSLLSKSSKIILLFIGEQKKEALRKFENEKIDYPLCPCKVAYETKSVIYTDIINNAKIQKIMNDKRQN